MVYALGLALIYGCKYFCNTGLKSKTPEFRKKVFVFVSFGILFLISACRGTSVGIDTLNYMEKFRRVSRTPLLDVLTSFYTARVEILYALINKIVSWFTAEPYVIIVINSALISAGMAYYVLHYADDDLTTVILFACAGMFVQSLNVTRQMIACILLLNSWGALTRGKYRTSAVLFLISMGFHVMSFIFVTVFFFWYFRNNKRVAAVFIALSFVVITCYHPIIDFASNFLTGFSFLTNQEDRIQANGIWALWSIMLIIAGCFLYCYFSGRRKLFGFPVPKELDNSEALLCVPLYVVYYILLTYIGTLFNYFNRLGLFFIPFVIPLFLNFGRVIRGRSLLLYRIYMVGLHVCYFAFLMLSTHEGQFKYWFP